MNLSMKKFPVSGFSPPPGSAAAGDAEAVAGAILDAVDGVIPGDGASPGAPGATAGAVGARPGAPEAGVIAGAVDMPGAATGAGGVTGAVTAGEPAPAGGGGGLCASEASANVNEQSEAVSSFFIG